MEPIAARSSSTYQLFDHRIYRRRHDGPADGWVINVAIRIRFESIKVYQMIEHQAINLASGAPKRGQRFLNWTIFWVNASAKYLFHTDDLQMVGWLLRTY